jgi:hypothetical protein
MTTKSQAACIRPEATVEADPRLGARARAGQLTVNSGTRSRRQGLVAGRRALREGKIQGTSVFTIR